MNVAEALSSEAVSTEERDTERVSENTGDRDGENVIALRFGYGASECETETNDAVKFTETNTVGVGVGGGVMVLVLDAESAAVTLEDREADPATERDLREPLIDNVLVGASEREMDDDVVSVEERMSVGDGVRLGVPDTDFESALRDTEADDDVVLVSKRVSVI